MSRYCAPLRCYCGDPGRPAYPSWVDLRADKGEARQEARDVAKGGGESGPDPHDQA